MRKPIAGDCLWVALITSATLSVLFEAVSGMNDTLLSKSGGDSKDLNHRVANVTLDVENLSYTPPSPSVTNRLRETILGSGIAPQMWNDRIKVKLHSEVDAELFDVSFRAMPGKFTAVISQEPAERRTLMELIGDRRRYGQFDGEITLLESNRLRGTLSVDNTTAYVPRVSDFDFMLTPASNLLHNALPSTLISLFLSFSLFLSLSVSLCLSLPLHHILLMLLYLTLRDWVIWKDDFVTFSEGKNAKIYFWGIVVFLYFSAVVLILWLYH